MAILDGADGTLTVDPTDEETACYQSRKAQADCEAQALEAFRTSPSQTKDGAALEICANIGTPQEAQQAMKYGADGVGLFRSEFLFMDRDALPTEDEQFEAYRTAAQTMAGKPLIIRTLDVGGDKKLPTLELPHEDNPFLGFRAIRMTLSHPEIFRPQLRAILRAAAYGDVRVMFPMIGSMDQLREAKALLREQEQTLQAEGVPTGPVKVGMMVEIPAAAVLAEEFAKEVLLHRHERPDAVYACGRARQRRCGTPLCAGASGRAAAHRHDGAGRCRAAHSLRHVRRGGWRPEAGPGLCRYGRE